MSSENIFGCLMGYYIILGAGTENDSVSRAYETRGLPVTTIPQYYFFLILVILRFPLLTVSPILTGVLIGFLVDLFFCILVSLNLLCLIVSPILSGALIGLSGMSLYLIYTKIMKIYLSIKKPSLKRAFNSPEVNFWSDFASHIQR